MIFSLVRPEIGETRSISVEKSIEPLGIQIESGSHGGIFVSTVNENSLALRAGIEVGDQILEVSVNNNNNNNNNSCKACLILMT